MTSRQVQSLDEGDIVQVRHSCGAAWSGEFRIEELQRGREGGQPIATGLLFYNGVRIRFTARPGPSPAAIVRLRQTGRRAAQEALEDDQPQPLALPLGQTAAPRSERPAAAKQRKLVKGEVSYMLHTRSGFAKSKREGDGGFKLTAYDNGVIIVEHAAAEIGTAAEIAAVAGYAEALAPYWDVNSSGTRLVLKERSE